jgi:tRNA pseudouridine55 synthase
VRELALLELAGQDLQLRVVCSKGTYVRVLAEDIGRSLGCGACLSALRRTGVGDFAVGRPAHSLGELQDMTPEQRDAILLPADALLASLPRLDLDAEQARRVMQGQAVGRPATGFAGLVRLYGPARDFLGLGEVLLPERVVPRRLISKSSPAGAGGELLLEKTRS